MNTFNAPTIPTALIEKIKTAKHLVVLMHGKAGDILPKLYDETFFITGAKNMMTLTIPDELEMPLSIAAQNKHMTPLDFVIGLLKKNLEQQSIQDDTDALLIHEQLMEQYAETFEKLAQ